MPGDDGHVIAKSATDQLRQRLQRRRRDLGFSTHKVAALANTYGFTNCTAKKVSQIENGNRGFDRDELLALARALETTVHELNTGLEGQSGEPVLIIGATARATAAARPGETEASGAGSSPRPRLDA